jgi:alpha-beta hydrolase superfamily lysophospholipase
MARLMGIASNILQRMSTRATIALLGALLTAVTTWADELPKTRAEALALEAQDALPITRFYDPPSPLPSAPPGALIRSEPFAGYALPPGAHAVRMLYHSRARDGRDVATSAVVLLPRGTPPAGGWPVIAWAHGTSGVARQCAPSLMRDVDYGSEGLMPMVAAGFAVIATDYAGLGTPGPHEYDNKIAQANDVVYSVPAARSIVPSLGARWVTIGHSQGGVAVWGAAELEATLHDAGYAGAISVAGDMDYESFEEHDSRTLTPVVSMYWPLTAFGVRASYPSFDPAQLLSPPFLERYADMTTKGCWYYTYAAAVEVASQPAVRHGWEQIPELQRYNEDSRSAIRPIKGPLLVLAGDDDQSVNFANIRGGVARACKLGLPIEFVHRPGLDHDPLMEKTIDLQLAWTRDRLAGKPWRGAGCAAALAAKRP